MNVFISVFVFLYLFIFLEIFVGIFIVFVVFFNVGLWDVIDIFVINNIGWGGGVKEYYRFWFGELF